MPKFPSHIIEKAVEVGFSDKEINNAQKNMALDAFEEQIAEREGGMLPDDIEGAELSGRIIETDMTGGDTLRVHHTPGVPEPILREVDPATLQRFEALCLLKGWEFGQKVGEVLESLLTEEGFARENRVE